MNDGQERHFDIDAIAAVARVELSPTEKDMLRGQLEKIVSYVNHMKTLNLDGEEPFRGVAEQCNVYDDDEICVSLDRAAMSANAPATMDGQIAVPRIVEGR